MSEILYIVVPCYNEEEVLRITAEQLDILMNDLKKTDKISSDSRVMFVDDGSKDKTWSIIEALASEKPDLFKGLKLAHNRGHQNALLAGLMTAKNYADITVSMDADLQDDPKAVYGFLEKRAEGCEIVYGVRSARKKDTWFKKNTAQGYYKMLSLMGVDIVYNHADYRLMSKRALEALSGYREVNLFLRGIVPTLGFKTAEVYYERDERAAGESKYPLKKMLSFAVDGVTSFSIKPIRMITALGFLIFIAAIIVSIVFIVEKCLGYTIQGWTSTVVSVWALGGLQLLAIGVIGEYIGKIYLETKARPPFIIEKEV